MLGVCLVNLRIFESFSYYNNAIFVIIIFLTYMGQNFERCTIGHFQTLSWFLLHLVRPQLLRTPFLLVSSLKSTIRAFRKHILYIPLLVFVHHTGLQMQKNDNLR